MNRDVVDVGHVLEAARRHWPGAVLGGVIGTLLAIAYVRVATPRYEAETSLRIDARPSTLPSIYAEQQVRDEVFTEIEVLRSRTIAADVVDELGLDVELTQPTRLSRDELVSSLQRTGPTAVEALELVRLEDGRYRVEGTSTVVTPGDTTTLDGVRFVLTPGERRPRLIELKFRTRDAAIESLLGEVDIGRAGLQANIIALRYESRDPALARDVLNAWTGSFMRRRQAIQRREATNTAAFIQAQLDTLQPQLARAEDRLLAFRNANGIVSPEADATTQISQRALLEAERNDLDAERSALQQAMARVRGQGTANATDTASPYRELIGFPTLLRNQAASELLRSLATLDDQRTALLMRRTTEDPDVIMLSERIRVVERQLQAIVQTYLRGLTAQVAAANASLATYASRMRQIPRKEVEYSRLQRAPRVYEGLVSLLQTRLKEAQITEAVQDASVRVVDPAVTPSKPSWPKIPLVLMLGLMSGMMAGAGWGFARASGDSLVRSRSDLQEITSVPVLGLIPSFVPRSRQLGEVAHDAAASRDARLGWPRPGPLVRSERMPERTAAEAYVRLYMNAVWTADAPLRTVIATSPLPGDGKTTSVIHLGSAVASLGRRVLLVDADLRRRGLTYNLALDARPGLIELMGHEASTAECIVSVTLPGGTVVDAIGAGSPSVATGLQQLVDGIAALLRQVTHYDAILIDTPPVNIVADAAALAPLADGVLLVTRAGETSIAAVVVAIEQLQRAGAPVLGTVLNRAELLRSDGYGTLQQYEAYTTARA